MKTINTNIYNTPAMPKGMAGNGYAPADYSGDKCVLVFF